MKKVIVFGSLNMDLTIESDRIPQKGETIDGHDFFTNTGGKGANQAVASAKLGAETFLIGRVGTDVFGNMALNKLKEYGVHCRLVSRSQNQPTGTAVILRCEGDNRIILSAGANHEIRIQEVEKALCSIAEPGDIFLTQFECDYQTTLDAVRLAKKMGLFTLMNPAPAKKIPDILYPLISQIVLNQTECEYLTGIYPQMEQDYRKVTEFFQAKGVGSVIVTLGAGGSITADSDEIRHVRSYRVPRVDTTAAGDCYIGALAAATARGESLAESMIFATKAAALTITKSGAQQSIPYANDLTEFYKEEREYE